MKEGDNVNEITKVSDITFQDVADYIRLPEVTSDDENVLKTLINVATAYIKNYTGQTDLDKYSDFVIVVLILCQDMWDTRAYYVDKSTTNKVVDTILDMHSINLLPNGEPND